MIKKILLGLLAIVLLFVVFVATRPANFRISRSATIAASPAVLFAQINDFHQWEAWSPWAKLDPNAVNSFEGPTSGVGAIFRWAGNNEVGEGAMTITESQPSDLIRIKLDFIKPFAATNLTEFTFVPQGEQTVVTWTMSGQNGFIGKAMGLFMNCDQMVGGKFEEGLASLKKVTHAQPQ